MNIFRKEELPMKLTQQETILAGVIVYYLCKAIDALLNLIINFRFQ